MKRFLLVPFLVGFHQPASFEASVNDGGGNRMYFDGSPRQKSYDCSTCHNDAPPTLAKPQGLITARVEGIAGAYTPALTYAITVALDGEHAGFGTANNQNGFVAEFIDDMNMPVGTLMSPDIDKLELVDDGKVVSGE